MGSIVGGIEAGGTKIVCAVGSGPTEILAEERIPTTTPAETLPRVLAFFRSAQERLGPVSAMGVGSFGPVDPDPSSPTFGHITSTPKPNWRDTDVVSPLRERFDVPVAFDTDVNAAAVGEARWGAAQGLDSFIYLTIGTGIGGGGLIRGRPLHGLIHPEMGHIRIPQTLPDDEFSGSCPFHGNCLEGLASGPAIARRWGTRAEDLPDDHPAWRYQSEYLALALQNFVCTLSPQRIILGGGVMEQTHLFAAVRTRLRELLNSYVSSPSLHEDIDTYVVPPGLGTRAGVLGAMAMALDARER